MARRAGAVLVVSCLVAAGCGSDESPAVGTSVDVSTTSTATTTVASPPVVVATSSTAPPASATTTEATSTTSTDAPTTAAPTTPTIAEPPPTPVEPVLAHVDVPPQQVAFDHLERCLPERCPEPLMLSDGTPVFWFRFDGVFLVGAPSPVTVVVTDPSVVEGYATPVAVGPGDVVYLETDTVDSFESRDLVAIPLRGPAAGSVVARSTHPGYPVFVSGAAGVLAFPFAEVPPPRHPPLDAVVAMPWVDESGAALPAPGVPDVWFEETPTGVDVIRVDAGTEVRRTLPGFVTVPNSGLFQLRADGGVAVAVFEDFDQFVYVVKPTGPVEKVAVPGDRRVRWISPAGTQVIADTVFSDETGDGFTTWTLPTFTASRDALSDLVAVLGLAPAATPDGVLDAVVAGLSAPDGCEVAPNATAVDRVDGDHVTVTVQYRFGCDDSGAGIDYDLAIAETGPGEWSLVAASGRSLCRRGATPDGAFCV